MGNRYALVNAAGHAEAVIVWDGKSPYPVPRGMLLVPEAEAPVEAAAPGPVPAMVTNFQARAALRRMGLLDAVNAAVLAAGGEAWDAWEYANHVHRSGVLVMALAAGLGLSSAAVDDLFRMAEGIEA